MKSGIISFFNIDEGRFSQVDEFQCMPHFSRYSWGLFRHRTKLLCRKCNNYIGNASQEKAPEYALVTQNSDPTSPRIGSVTKYDIRIRSLQPSSAVALLWVLLLLLYIPADILNLLRSFGFRSSMKCLLSAWYCFDKVGLAFQLYSSNNNLPYVSCSNS